MSLNRSLSRSLLFVVTLLALPFLLLVSSANGKSGFVVDASFGNKGLIEEGVGPIASSAMLNPKILARDAQGRVIVGAGNGDGWSVWRFLPDGSPDLSFGDQGKVVITSWWGYGNRFANLASGVVKPNGRILLVGCSGSDFVANNVRRGNSSMILTQLMPDGSPDLTFGPTDGGRFFGAGKGAVKVVLQPDGGFLVGAFKQIRESGRTDDGALFRFTANGRIDRDFGPGNDLSALNVLGAPGKPSNVFDVDLLANGRILLSGSSKNRFWLMRLRRDGTRDPSFGKKGQVIMLPGSKKLTHGALAPDLELDRKGRILVAGFAVPKDFEKGTGFGLVLRLRKNGQLDRSFGSNGIARLYATPRLGTRYTRLYDIQTDNQGGIWVTGSAGPQPRNQRRAVIARYRPNGTKDPEFFKKGVLNIRMGDGSVGSALVRAGEKMYLSGRYDQGDQERFFVKRLMPSR